MRRRETLLAVAGTLSGLLTSGTARAAADVGQKAPSFEVIDAANRKRSSAEFAGKIVVLEWTSPSCPFVRAQYVSGKMQESQRWAMNQGVVWLSVLSTNASRADFLEPAKAGAFNRTRNASPTALLIDSAGIMGRAYGAKTTPHMFVIATSGQLAYAGAIDTKATVDEAIVPLSRNLVRPAIEDLMAGRKVSTPKTAPYGCLVGYEA